MKHAALSLLWLGTAASVTANVVLAGQMSGAGEAAKAATPRARPSTCTPKRPIAGACTDALGECRDAVDACGVALEKCEDIDRDARPLGADHARGSPDPERERRVRPRIEHALAEFPHVRPVISCRDDVCRVDLEGGNIDAVNAVVGIPGADIGSIGEVSGPKDHKHMYIRVGPASMVSGRPTLEEIVTKLLDSKTIEQCRRDHWEAGTLQIRLDLRSDVGLIQQVGGSLGLRPLAGCTTAAIDRVAESVELPAAFRHATVWLTVRVRPDPDRPAEIVVKDGWMDPTPND